MTSYGGLACDAKDVLVELVEISFLHLRSHVPAELLRPPDDHDILAWVQREVNVAPQPLSIDADQHRILKSLYETLVQRHGMRSRFLK